MTPTIRRFPIFILLVLTVQWTLCASAWAQSFSEQIEKYQAAIAVDANDYSPHFNLDWSLAEKKLGAQVSKSSNGIPYPTPQLRSPKSCFLRSLVKAGNLPV